VTGNDETLPHKSGSDPEVTSFDRSHLEAALEGLKVAYTSYKAVACRRRQLRDRI